MDLKTTLYAVDDRIATITLNRPHRGNAWTGRMHTEYRHLLDQAEKDPDVSRIHSVRDKGRSSVRVRTVPSIHFQRTPGYVTRTNQSCAPFSKVVHRQITTYYCTVVYE